MKTLLKILLTVLLIVSIFFIWTKVVGWSYKKQIKDGDIIVQKVEEFYDNNGIYPDSLSEIDVVLEKFTKDDYYYNTYEEGGYQIYFTTVGVGESIRYQSKNGIWE